MQKSDRGKQVLAIYAAQSRMCVFFIYQHASYTMDIHNKYIGFMDNRASVWIFVLL